METTAQFVTEYYIMKGFGYDHDEAFECAYNKINGDWNNPTMINIAQSWIKMFMERA